MNTSRLCDRDAKKAFPFALRQQLKPSATSAAMDGWHGRAPLKGQVTLSVPKALRAGLYFLFAVILHLANSPCPRAVAAEATTMLQSNGIETESPFTVVFIDSQTEQEYGQFPFDRAILARGIEQIKKCRPKGIVLKFFLDLPKNPASDAALARSFQGIPVILEARILNSEANPNRLPDRFTLPNPPGPNDVSLAGQSGWVPLETFSANAYDVGFVDASTPEKIPLLEKYRGRYVKSLSLCVLEMAFGAKAQIAPGASVSMQEFHIPIDQANQVAVGFPAKDELAYIPFHELFTDGFERSRLSGKVVILGYDGPGIHTVDSPIGKIKAHRYFVFGLEGVFKKAVGGKSRSAGGG